MSKPTAEQMEHFYELQKKGVINSTNLQAFLEKPGRSIPGILTVYDQSEGFNVLVQQACTKYGYSLRIGAGIDQRNFPRAEKLVRRVQLRVEPYRSHETSQQAASRLAMAGYTLADVWNLAGFLYKHPEEMKRWRKVLAISHTSSWSNYPDGQIWVPYAALCNTVCEFDRSDFCDEFFDLSSGILVRCDIGA